MAVPEQIPVVNYVADGIVKKFDVPFEYDQQSDLHVYVDGAEPTIDKYFFTDNSFNFYIAPINGQAVKIKRITPKERDTDYNLHTNTVRPKALNTDFDRLWYVLQEVFSDVGGLSQAVQDEIIARIQGDEDLLNQLTAEISARMLGDEAVTEDLKNYVNQVVGAIIGDPSFTGIDAKNVNDASEETQQQVNYNGGSKWHSRVGGYQVNERAVLDNGDIVKSTVINNTNNPNTDLTGWVNDNAASQIFDSGLNLNQAQINELLKTKSDYTVWLKDFGAICDGVTDDTVAFKAALQHLKDNGGGVLRLGKGRILVTQPIDLGDYVVLDSSLEASYPLVYINIDIIGEGLKSTTLVWKGGTDSNGGYGTCLTLRSKTLAGVESYYFGRVSDFYIDVYDLNTKRGHSGGWPITNRFTTVASSIASCDPITGSLAAYPTLIDKVNRNQGASCGLYARTISPSQIQNIQVRGFAYGFWMGVGYGTSIDSIAARWNMCGIRFADAITTTTPQNSIFEKNAVGVMFNVTSHVGLGEGCVVQGNYAGCDVLFHSWNRRTRFDNVYFEASVKGIVIRTDSSGQYRNSEVTFKSCTGVQLDVDIAAISEMYLEDNHIQSTQFNATGTGLPDPAQHYAVRVKNNFSYDNTTTERRKMLWNDWNIPDKYLYCEDTMQITGFDYPRIDTLSSGAKSSATKIQAGSATNDFTLKVPNARSACVLKLEGVACRYGDDLKDLLYFTCAIAVTRQPNGVAIAEVGAITSTLMAVQATGISIGSPAVVTAVVSGAADAANTITVKASKIASGGNGAIQAIDAKLLTAVGTVQLNKA